MSPTFSANFFDVDCRDNGNVQKYSILWRVSDNFELHVLHFGAQKRIIYTQFWKMVNSYFDEQKYSLRRPSKNHPVRQVVSYILTPASAYARTTSNV